MTSTTIRAALAALTISVAAGAAPQANAAASDHTWRNLRYPALAVPIRAVGSSCIDVPEFAAAKTTWNTALICIKYVPGFSRRHWTYLRQDLDHPGQYCTSDGHYFPFDSEAAKTYNPSECRVVK
jgi:hypothetical protein